MYGLGVWDQQEMIHVGRVHCPQSGEMGGKSGLYFSSPCSAILIEPPCTKYDASLQGKHPLTGQLMEWYALVELKT